MKTVLAGSHALCLMRQTRTSAWNCLRSDNAELRGCHACFSAGSMSALQVFKVAKAMAPSVIHIDEVEKVFVSDKKRAKEFGGTELFSRIKKELGKEVGRCLHWQTELLCISSAAWGQDLLVSQFQPALVPAAVTLDMSDLRRPVPCASRSSSRGGLPCCTITPGAMQSLPAQGHFLSFAAMSQCVGARQRLTSSQHSGPLESPFGQKQCVVRHLSSALGVVKAGDALQHLHVPADLCGHGTLVLQTCELVQCKAEAFTSSWAAMPPLPGWSNIDTWPQPIEWAPAGADEGPGAVHTCAGAGHQLRATDVCEKG